MKKTETKVLTLNFNEIELSRLHDARRLICEILDYMDYHQLERIENDEYSFTAKELETTCATISHITVYNSLEARIVEAEAEEEE